MKIEKSRKAFEDFIIERDGLIWVSVMGACRSYSDEIDKDFELWQASRAAIVVELPESIGVTPIGGDGIQEFEDCNGEYLRGFQVVLAIEALGLKVAK